MEFSADIDVVATLAVGAVERAVTAIDFGLVRFGREFFVERHTVRVGVWREERFGELLRVCELRGCTEADQSFLLHRLRITPARITAASTYVISGQRTRISPRATTVYVGRPG